MFAQHHRYAIHNQNQHPYKHTLSEFNYVNPALPEGEVINMQQAMDWLFAVLYPQAQEAVDTPGDLPLAGNTLNDYRVVNNDGDGRAASYRWEQREGDATPQWYKVYDMDWGEDSILSNFLLKTQDVYVYRYGVDDLDETGSPYAGDLAGQRIYGGQSAGTHLLLYANSGDGVGAGTGYVQFGDDARPLVDSSYTLGTDTYRWLNFYTDEANVGNLNIVEGVAQTEITSSTGVIDFGTTNLGTDGTLGVGDLLISNGVDRSFITSALGLIDFDDENLTTRGFLTVNHVIATGPVSTPSAFATGTTIGDLTLADGSITSATATIDFIANNLSTTGGGVFGDLLVDNIDIDLNTISTISGDLNLVPIGNLNVTANTFLTGDLDVSGTVTVGPADNAVFSDTGLATTGAFAFSSTAGGFSFAPNNLEVDFTANLDPTVDDTYDLGESGQRWKDLYLSGFLADGPDATDRITVDTLVSFRDANVAVADGMSLFWNAVDQKWLPSAPDTEIDHGTISGLLDDDHPQYLFTDGSGNGRPGGQSLVGGNAAGDDLNLDSTSSVTKGTVNFFSPLAPGGDNTLDIGSGSFRVRDLYMGGQGIGFRFENLGALPAAGNNGRAVWFNSTTLFIDDGTQWQELSSNKFVDTQSAAIWDGTQTTHPVNVSSQFNDAREAIWQFLDNTNGFREVNGAVITKTATVVTVTFTIPPASGSYTLVGVG